MAHAAIQAVAATAHAVAHAVIVVAVQAAATVTHVAQIVASATMVKHGSRNVIKVQMNTR